MNKLSATIKNKPVLLFVILANKYGITTYLNFLSIDNFCSSIKLKLLWLWITLNSWQALTYKNKRQSILAHKYKITFLPHFLEQW